MAGRRPTPTHLKVVTGNPGKRAINKNEPKPPADPVKMPAHLNATAKSAWTNVKSILGRMGVLSKADEYALERLVSCYAEIRDCEKAIKTHGRTYETYNDSGGIMHRPRPEVAMLADADRRFKSYLVEFGLTPAARSKIQIDESKKDDLEEFFGKKAR